MNDDFLLPDEVLTRVGVPDNALAQVAYLVLASKYCALVEAVMKITGGEPVELSLERVKEMLAMTPATDPRESVVVMEEKLDHQPGPTILIRLATVEEIQTVNRRAALNRMGARRN